MTEEGSSKGLRLLGGTGLRSMAEDRSSKGLRSMAEVGSSKELRSMAEEGSSKGLQSGRGRI